jgi:hypothetical protein
MMKEIKELKNQLLGCLIRLYASRVMMPLCAVALFVQRSPAVKMLAEMKFSNPFRAVQSIPAVVTTAVSMGGYHAVSGATRDVMPASDAFPNPLQVTAGDTISWAMQVELRKEQAKSWELKRYSGPTLSGLRTSILATNLGGISGTLNEPGTYVMEIIAWENSNNSGDRSKPFFLTIEVGAAASPFDTKFPDVVNDPSGWSESPWFGWIYGGEFPKIRHVNHGEIYMADNASPNQHFYYDFRLGSWLYTANTLYPYLYVYSSQEWYYYMIGTGDGDSSPRWFKTFGPGGDWFSEDNL